MRVNAMNVVTGSVGWASGDLGIIPSSDSGGAEGFDPTNGRPSALASLLNITIALGFVFCFLILFQVSVHLYWKYRANRAFYSKNELVGLVLKGKVQSFDELDKLSSKANRAFRPFPVFLVFPSLFVFAFKVFATGLVKNAAALLATPATSCALQSDSLPCDGCSSRIHSVCVGSAHSFQSPLSEVYLEARRRSIDGSESR